jgi:hypothetical protein
MTLSLFAVLIWAGVTVGTGIVKAISDHKSKKELEAKALDLSQDCPGDGLTLQAAPTAPSFSAATGVHITLTTTNHLPTPCKVPTTPDTRVLTITSGSDLIYTSAACNVEDSGLVLLAGEAATQDVSWSLRRTGEDGCASGEVVSPGYYVAHISYPGLTPLAASDVGFYIQ